MSREGDATSSEGGPATPAVIRQAPGYLARRLHQAYIAAWARRVDPVLTGPQYAVLVTVDAHPRLDQGSLAHTVALDRSTMADVCRRLEDRGLIERTQAPADGRRKLIGLTEEGRAALQRLQDRVLALESELMADHASGVGELLERLDALSRRWETVATGTAT
ncbi:MarR family transcriptional regulator [Actinomycetospora lutea]|uniref:MarR family winged helix-turn-helix transcriptional regulator n=1 Tax=Actinomycetospora lutea TaxID=663604 RepID=UPI00236713D8|nr:MarR family transcriptional regulator [Actinomycetospora lutea]MDD7937002.1 MarR family transcriptional regulator [Actinomycetospora lutea]